MASKMTQIMKMKNEEEEEVKCICPDCWGEGWCFVSKKRAEELKAMELIEECCPFGDRCAASDEDEEEGYASDEDEEED